MKPTFILKLSLILCLILFSVVFTKKNLKSKKKTANKISKAHKTNQLHFVKDHNGFHSSLNQVVRRNPTLSVTTKYGSENLAAPSAIIHAGNSNTSNGPNIGTFGPSAEIVGNYFFFKQKNLILLCILKEHSVLSLSNLLILDGELIERL